MVRRDKIHISVSEDVMEFDEFGNGATMLSNHEVLLFCGKECLLESLLKESIGAEHVLDWISEWEWITEGSWKRKPNPLGLGSSLPRNKYMPNMQSLW